MVQIHLESYLTQMYVLSIGLKAPGQGEGRGGVLSNLKRRRRAIEKSKKYCIVTLNTFTFIFVLSTLYCS